MKVANDLQPGDILDRLLSAIAASDLPATLACFTSGLDVEVVGSEKGEQARGREAVESFFRRVYSKPRAYPGTSHGWLLTAVSQSREILRASHTV